MGTLRYIKKYDDNSRYAMINHTVNYCSAFMENPTKVSLFWMTMDGKMEEDTLNINRDDFAYHDDEGYLVFHNRTFYLEPGSNPDYDSEQPDAWRKNP